MTSIWLRDLAFYGLQVVLLVGSGAVLARLFRFRASILTLVYWQALLALCLILPVCQHWKAAPTTSPQILAGSAATVGATLPDLARPAHVAQSRPWPIEQAVLLIIVVGIVMRGLWLATGFGRLAGCGVIPWGLLPPSSLFLPQPGRRSELTLSFVSRKGRLLPSPSVCAGLSFCCRQASGQWRPRRNEPSSATSLFMSGVATGRGASRRNSSAPCSGFTPLSGGLSNAFTLPANNSWTRP